MTTADMDDLRQQRCARLVLPGRAPDTRFDENARARMVAGAPIAYPDFTKRVFTSSLQADAAVTRSDDVATAVWRAVTDRSSPFRIPAGADALAWAAAA